jgi:NTE family protein
MGFAVEAAKLQTVYTMTDEGDWLDSGVIYLGGETPLGPVYLGYGFSFSGDYNLYFKLGAF